MLAQAKIRSKQNGIVLDIKESDIVAESICPALNIPIFYDCSRLCDNSPSIDRIDNTHGYIKGNVRVISWRANAIKGDATIEELMKVREYMYNNLIGQNNDKHTE